MKKMQKYFTHAVVSKTDSSDVQRDLCSWQHFPTAFDILGLILDRDYWSNIHSVSILWFDLTKLEKPTSHWHRTKIARFIFSKKGELSVKRRTKTANKIAEKSQTLYQKKPIKSQTLHLTKSNLLNNLPPHNSNSYKNTSCVLTASGDSRIKKWGATAGPRKK